MGKTNHKLEQSYRSTGEVKTTEFPEQYSNFFIQTWTQISSAELNLSEGKIVQDKGIY